MIKQGYILSRSTISIGNQSYVELWVATEEGAVCLHSDPQYPSCFIAASEKAKLTTLASQNNLDIRYSDDDFRTLEQTPVITVKTANESTMHQLRGLAKDHGITLFEADIRLADRFLMERFIYGALEFFCPSNIEHSHKGIPNTIKQAKVRAGHYTPSLTSISLDIECDEHENLYSIAIASSQCNQVIVVRDPAHPARYITDNLPFQIEEVHSESALLTKTMATINAIDPDIIMGWNIKQFDMAVLFRRAQKAKLTFTIGRNNSALSIRQWEGQTWVDLPGRAVIDGIEALKTMTYHFDSFSLDNVSRQLLGKQKLIQSEDKLAEIKRLYKEDPIALAKYNHEDCVLVNNIASQTKYIDFLILRGTLTGLDIGRPGGSVAAFLNVYLPKRHRKGYVSGVRPENGGLASPGGYVMTSQPGLYDDVLVLDYKSLYPSIIRTFKIDPLGLAEGLKHPETAIPGFKGAMFSKESHFLPAIIDNLWKQRDEAKKAKDAPRSQAIKILMNSFYGVLGSGGCPFYDPRLASSITLRGHEIMQTTAKWIEELGYVVIYGDTDSTFVHIEGNTDLGTPQQTGEALAKEINQRWREKLKKEMNITCFLEIEFETHFSKFFMPTIRGSVLGSKKRYAGIKVNSSSKEIVFKGLENVRSDWTELAKQFQYELYSRVFNDEPVIGYIKTLIQQVREGKMDEHLVYSKRLRKPLSEYVKAMPPHVKAAKHADNLNKQQGLPLRYQNNTSVSYVITLAGPQTLEHVSAQYDYQHYIDKQIRPIADSILPLINLSFDNITADQLPLFS